MEPLMPHFFLQLLVNPEAGEFLIRVYSSVNFTVITDDPRLGHIKRGNSHPPDPPVLLYDVPICLYTQPPLLLNGGSGYGGLIHLIINRITDIGFVISCFRVSLT